MRLCEIAAGLPVEEFYISDEYAVRYTRNRFCYDKTTSFANKYKQQLYEALYEQFLELRQQERYAGRPLAEVVQAALCTPAPCIGMTPRAIYMHIPHRKYPRNKEEE